MPAGRPPCWISNVLNHRFLSTRSLHTSDISRSSSHLESLLDNFIDERPDTAIRVKKVEQSLRACITIPAVCISNPCACIDLTSFSISRISCRTGWVILEEQPTSVSPGVPNNECAVVGKGSYARDDLHTYRNYVISPPYQLHPST